MEIEKAHKYYKLISAGLNIYTWNVFCRQMRLRWLLPILNNDLEIKILYWK